MSLSNPEKSNSDHKRRERQDWGIVLLILLIGFLCVIVAGQQAMSFAPRWTLDANVESNIDLNSEFLTSQPVGYFEPLDPAILTQPGWASVFLTPGASIPVGTPLAASDPNSAGSTATLAGTIPTITGTLAATSTGTVIPTNTLIWIPLPATNTPKPKDPPAATPTNTPVLNADVAVQVIDGTTVYAAGGPFTYQVIVTNNGPDPVIGAVVTANRPGQAATWDWACSPAVPTCDGMTSGAGPFSDTVNLANGASIVYTVTAMIPAGVSNSLDLTVNVNSPGGPPDPVAANNSAPDSNSPGVDLQIVKDDGVTAYGAGGSLTYTIQVTNNSSFTVNNVMVTDIFSEQIASLSWNCAPAAICSSSGTGNINDSLNMPAGPGSVATYTVNVTMEAAAVGPLTNTASVAAPAGFTELTLADNSDFDTDAGPSAGAINIGPRDSGVTTLTVPGSLTMAIPPLIANGDGTYDLVYYEMVASSLNPPGQHIDLDLVQVQISTDGGTWYTVFDWGDGAPNAHTNVPVAPAWCAPAAPAEADNCGILSSSLYNVTGVAIDIDAIVPPGNYGWIRILSPSGGDNDGSDVDAIEVLP